MRCRLVYGHILAIVLPLTAFQLPTPPALAVCPQPQFRSPIVTSGPGFGPAPQAVLSGDFNNDGLADLLIGDTAGAAVFLANGSGRFMNQFSSGTSLGPHAVAILDANGDENLDFAMVYSSDAITHDGTILILHIGDGTGNFNAPLELYQEVGPMEDPRSMVAGDFNGDGHADLVVGAREGPSTHRLTWCLGDGNGHFAMNHAGMQFASNVDDPVALGAGDFDADGKSDLVVHSVHATASSTTQQDAFVLFGGAGSGASGIVQQLSVGESPAFEWTHIGSNSVSVADLNGDGKLDLAVQDRSAGAVSISLGTGTRQLGPMAPYPAGGIAVVAGDLNGDGRVDLATADPGPERACVLLGDGTGAFGTATCVPSGGFSTSIAIERFNRDDGMLDLAVANKDEREAAVMLNACPGPPIDIRATAVEVTQVVQDLTNSVRLVAGKRTFARVHVSANYDLLPVTASLQPLDTNGAPVGQALLPANPRALVAVRSSPDRASLDDAFYFELPSTVTQAGSITLKATVNPHRTMAESDYANNSVTSSPVTFVSTKPMELRVVDYSLKRPDGFVIENDPEDLVQLEREIRAVMPVGALSITRVAVYDAMPPAVVVDGNDNPRQDADALLSWLQNYRATKEPANAGVLYYLLTKAVHGQAESIPGRNAVGTWGDATHELGHLLGRYHVNCDGTEGGPDLSYPYPGGRIGGPASAPSRYFGWSSGADRPAIVPPTTGDLMSYCARWLSDYNLEAIWNYREAQAGMAPGFQQLRTAAMPSSSGDFLAVYGSIDRITEDLSLTEVTRLSIVGEVPAMTPGPYHIRLLDEFGSALADHPFEPGSTTEGGTGALIGQIVDFVPGTREVQIYSDNSARVLATVPVSANPPTVTITTPVAGVALSETDALTLEWLGSDLDGDALHYDIYYSSDGGAVWQLLLTGLSSESAFIESRSLRGSGGGSTGFFRVVASDGVLTGSDEAGGMTVADKPPAVQVLHPSVATSFAFGQTVTLEGWAQDLEEGAVDDTRFQWLSNRGGLLGTGRLLHLLDLESGTHTITLAATDRSGGVGYASVVVTVGPVVVRNSAPAFTSVSATTTVKEGMPVSLHASAGDPDASQAITVTASGYPASLVFTEGSAVSPETAQASVTGVTRYSDGDANPATYTIEWVASDGTLSAAASTVLSVFDVVPIAFDLTPETLNLRSMGRYVTAYLEPPSPYTPEDIEVASIVLNETIPADATVPAEIGDHDSDGSPDLAVKFDRATLELKLQAGENVKVVVTGSMAGHYLIGTDFIRVLRAVVTSPAAGTSLTPGGTTTISWSTPSGVMIESVALLSSLNGGASWSLIASGLPNLGRYEWDVPDVIASQGQVAVVLVESADETGFLVDGVVGTSGTFTIGNVTGVEQSEGAEFALRVVRPNPTQEGLRVTFGLPDARPARIEVFSVNGRRVEGREVGGMGPGKHTILLDDGRTLASGVYLIRLSQGGRKLTTRAVIVR